jgi:hypothetical protein
MPQLTGEFHILIPGGLVFRAVHHSQHFVAAVSPHLVS